MDAITICTLRFVRYDVYFLALTSEPPLAEFLLPLAISFLPLLAFAFLSLLLIKDLAKAAEQFQRRFRFRITEGIQAIPPTYKD